MSEPSDGGGSGKPDEPEGAAAATSDRAEGEPKSRASGVAIPSDEPPVRPSSVELRPERPKYPDDSNLSRSLRKVDDYVGIGEQAILVFLFLALVVLTAGSALLEKSINFRFHEKDDVIRACTFALAMIGMAFASHQLKHLALDLVSRKLRPRPRLFLNIFLGLFTIFIVILFIRGGLKNADIESGMADEGKLLSNARLAWLIPVGGFLVLVHTILHTVIDIDYAARHKVPPERARSAH